jgi:soluble lytic murein transglycosylase-like protein
VHGSGTNTNRRLSVAFAAAAAGALLSLGADEAFAPEASGPELIACFPEARFEPARDPMQDVLVKHLSRRFLIAREPIERMVAAAFRAGPQAGLDPLLVLAVIAVESRFNPIAESSMGARGLMQIIPRFHQAKLVEYGGEAVLFDPEVNILLGVQILHEYVRRTGTIEAGLQFYNGALSDLNGQYAAKVMAERDRLLWVLRQRQATTVATLSGG